MIFSFQILVVKYGEISKWSSWEQSFNSLTQTQFIVFLYGRLGELRLRLNMQNDFNTIYTQTPHTHKMQGSNFWRLHFLSQNIKTLGRCMLLNFSYLKNCFALESESKSKLWCYLLCSVASQFSLKKLPSPPSPLRWQPCKNLRLTCLYQKRPFLVLLWH